MLYGWLNTTCDNNWYYFETDNGLNRGKMIIDAWKKIKDKWYYFGLDGIMYKNQITPDGYIVNGNGEWVQ